jgi:hypothetical protein
MSCIFVPAQRNRGFVITGKLLKNKLYFSLLCRYFNYLCNRLTRQWFGYVARRDLEIKILKDKFFDLLKYSLKKLRLANST